MKNWVILVGISLCAMAANACDPKTDRCKKVMELMDLMRYHEQVAAVQMSCRGKAAALHPDQLEKSRPRMLLGLLKTSESWSQMHTAYDKYLEDACGGNEVLYLILGGYRHAWDAQLTGARLEDAIKAVKARGREAINDDATVVKTRVNEVMLPLLVRMGQVAEQRYASRIKGVVTGEALEVAESDMCSGSKGPNGGLTPLSEVVLRPPG